jgi:hypothetical protein
MAPSTRYSGALRGALSTCAGRDRRWATGGRRSCDISNGIHAKAPRQLAVGLTEMVSTARGEQQVKTLKEV